MTINHKTAPALWRRIAATAVGAGAIAVGAMAVTAPLVTAAPVSEARAECGSHDSRDVYTTSTSNGHTTETCCYHSGIIVEIIRCSTWVDGKWVSTTRDEPVAPPKPNVPGVQPLPPGEMSPRQDPVSPKGPIAPITSLPGRSPQ